ncbi:actin filament-associated protein 1-like 2 isoform X2 [Pleurodeles waltl]|uniref:actin filament-associated protein 1-like 2 isoform X2 n=1 Tax=Pleurodeles waltl TaxID=8319 RepID=UPI003709B4EE
MENRRDLDRLLSDLRAFLLVLDQEKLSLEAQMKKESMVALLARLQNSPAEDAEYMTMNCIASSGGNGCHRDPGICTARKGCKSQNSSEKENFQGIPAPRCRLPLHLPTPESERPNLGLPSHLQQQEQDDSYEEAEPLSPRGHSNAGSADTDSSHYESYGEEDECVKDRAHYIQWSASSGVSNGSGRTESQICGFLWRKKWLGQWAKQLFIIREHLLLCYKCARDLQPLLQLDLRGCRVAYKPKHSKKMQHELKICGSSETLVMGFQSRQQAEEWRKVIEDVSSSPLWNPSSNNSPALPGKDRSKNSPQTGKERSRYSPRPGTERSRHSPQPSTDRTKHSLHPTTDRSQPPPLSTTDSSRHSPQVKSAAQRSDPNHNLTPTPVTTQEPGFLNMLLGNQWQSFWCLVERGVLRMFRDSGCTGPPVHFVVLPGSDVTPSRGPDLGLRYGISISKHGKDVAILETPSEEERGLWLKLLRAGSEGSPESEALSSYEETNTQMASLADVSSPASVGALLLRKLPTPNPYMDDPFRQITTPAAPVYSNAEISQQLHHSFNSMSQHGSSLPLPSPHPGSPQEQQINNGPVLATEKSAIKSNFAKSHSDYQMQRHTPPLREKGCFGSQQNLTLSETKRSLDELALPFGKRVIPTPHEKIGALEQVCQMRTQLKAGSEMNLLSISRSCTQASCDYVHSAGSERTNPSTVLKRAASAKSTLKRVPSVVVIEKGRVLQKRKEWEMKASA